MVRLPDQRRLTRTALISFASTVVVASCILVVWSHWYSQPSIVPHQRDLTDIMVSWRCPKGHRFVDRGATSSRVCPQCGRDADVVMEYKCPQHGRVDMLLRYSTTSTGRTKPTHYSPNGREWVAMTEASFPCQKCNRPLESLPRVFGASISHNTAP